MWNKVDWEITQICALRNVNAGRMLTHFNHHVGYNLIEEKRKGRYPFM